MKRLGTEKYRFPVFRERFRELQGDMSNTEFADFLGLSRQTVGFYCNGERIPDALVLKHIAEKCNVSADWLLGLSEIRSTDIDVQRICKKTGLSEKAANVLLALGEETQEDHDDILPYIDTVNGLIGWQDFIILLDQLRRIKPYNATIETIAAQALPIFDKITSFDSQKNSSSLYNTAASIFLTILKLHNDMRIMRFNVIDSFTDFVNELCDSTNYKKWEQQFNKIDSGSKLLHLINDKTDKIAEARGRKIDMSELIDEMQSNIADLTDSLS